jgi:two-component system CheB/CheR fusion protein
MNRLQDDRCRVLVVDDSKDNADSIAMLLEIDQGYEIRTAYDGEQALDAFDAFDPEVALLDLAVPKINGYDLARTFKTRKPQIKLIAVSGLAFPADIERSRQAGFIHHLVKPFDPQELKRALEEECDQAKGNGARSGARCQT